MLDIKFVRENKKLVEKAIESKKVKADLAKILLLDEKKRDLQNKVEKLQFESNQISNGKHSYKENLERLKEQEQLGLKPSIEAMTKALEIKKMLLDLKPQLNEVSEELLELMLHLPNVPAKDVKTGKDESDNEVIKTVGKPRKFDFKVKDHMELGTSLDLIDIQRAGKVSGSRFSYIKNQAVILEFALVRFLMDMLQKEGFTPIIPPVLEKMDIAKGTGYFEALNDDAYHTTEDEMVLVGTSEQSILPYYMDEVISGQLPKRFVSFSTCFRREAGSYGKDVTGIFRQHQFDKVEMVVFSDSAKSDKEHEFILSLEEKIIKTLELPYQVVKMCTGDLGAPAARKYDIEAWIPSQNKYRELTSCSTCTDFQARRLNIRYKNKEGKTEFVHTLNGTGLAIGRTLIALLENHQQEDGSVLIPKALQKYTGFNKISNK